MNNTAKKVSQNSTISRSGLDYRGAHTSGNMNRSNNPIIGNTGGATALNALNSNINDCNFKFYSHNSQLNLRLNLVTAQRRRAYSNHSVMKWNASCQRSRKLLLLKKTRNKLKCNSRI